jgi:hypothetical protein
MTHVFISHANKDGDIAQQLCAVLERHGVPCWIAPRDIPAGADWRAAIVNAISASDLMITLISEDASRSEQIARDLDRADRDRVPILPIRLDDVPVAGELRYFLGTRQWLDLSLRSLDDCEFEVVQAVQNLQTAAPHIEKAQSKAVDSRPGTIGPAHSVSATMVFICYRREDSEHAAGRLHDRLVNAYGHDRVFRDIDSVPLGIDFVDHVSEQIARCTAVLVVIGKQWLKARDKSRRRRLDNENDLVRAEVAAALQQKVPVIPVLVDNAKMPTAEELPDNIRGLARRNGTPLSSSGWSTDVERLINALDRVMKG